MKGISGLAVATVLLAAASLGALAAEAPTPQQGEYIARNFKLHDGTVMKEVRLHYTTLGSREAEPVLVLHGTAGDAGSMLVPSFAGALFGPGQPLDAATHFIVIPDALGAGQSSKPSDGLRAAFPAYTYDDMVAAQYELLTEGLGIRHLRLVIGNSMGGMETWLWGEQHPAFMDALVPMASQPTAMSSRNWMTRRLLIDSVRNDPAWQGGNYTEQPPMLRYANVWMGVATSGGTMRYAAQAPTRAAADQLLAARYAAPPPADANDFIYQWDASRDFDASPALEAITAKVLVINSADDERNPPETGLLETALKRVKDARYLLIPASAETAGHGTTMIGKFYAQTLADFLATVPKRAM